MKLITVRYHVTNEKKTYTVVMFLRKRTITTLIGSEERFITALTTRQQMEKEINGKVCSYPSQQLGR